MLSSFDPGAAPYTAEQVRWCFGKTPMPMTKETMIAA
jgi:hypothetical protein